MRVCGSLRNASGLRKSGDSAHSTGKTLPPMLGSKQTAVLVHAKADILRTGIADSQKLAAWKRRPLRRVYPCGFYENPTIAA
jgi:hypothetical protein